MSTVKSNGPQGMGEFSAVKDYYGAVASPGRQLLRPRMARGSRGAPRSSSGANAVCSLVASLAAWITTLKAGQMKKWLLL